MAPVITGLFHQDLRVANMCLRYVQQVHQQGTQVDTHAINQIPISPLMVHTPLTV
jgi:hypothetical protein